MAFNTPASGPVDGVPRRRRGAPKATSVGLEVHRIGNVSILGQAARPPATALARCLEAVEQSWKRSGNLGALWQRWPQLAGARLAPHCRPLRLSGSTLTVGAPPGPWLQALQYNRHQLLANLRAAGFPIRTIRFEQHQPGTLPARAALLEADSWARHPSRVDVHGMATCPRCQAPAPTGEMARWGHCSFCRRQEIETPMITAETDPTQ